MMPECNRDADSEVKRRWNRRIQLKAVISLIMICQMIVLHQSTAPCKEEEDEGKEQDVVLQLHQGVEIDPVVVVPPVVVPPVVVPGEGGVVVTKDQIGKS